MDNSVLNFNFLINYFNDIDEENLLNQFDNINLNLNKITGLLSVIPLELKNNIKFNDIINGLGIFLSDLLNNDYDDLSIDDYIYYFLYNGAIKFPELLMPILNSDYVKKNPFIYAIDKFKKNILILMTFNNDNTIFKEVLNTKWFLDKYIELLEFKDNNLQYSFCNYLFHNNKLEIIYYLYEKKILNNKIILEKNSNNDTNLILGIRFGIEYFNFFLNLEYEQSDISKKDFLNSINNNNISCLHNACRYSLESTLALLQNDFIDLDFLKNKGNILFRSCYYFNFNNLDILLKDFNLYDLLEKEYVDDADINILFASVKSYDCFLYLLNELSKDSITKMMDKVNVNGDNILIYSSKYNLKVFEFLLENFESKMLEIKDHINNDNKVYLYYLLDINIKYKNLFKIYDLLLKKEFINKNTLKIKCSDDKQLIFNCINIKYLFNKLFENKIIDEEILSLRLNDKSIIYYLIDYYNIKNILNSDLIINLIRNNIITELDLYDFLKYFSFNYGNKLNSIIFSDIFSLGIIDLKIIINKINNRITILDNISKSSLKFFLDNKFINYEVFSNINDEIILNSNYLIKNIIKGNFEIVQLICDSNLMTLEIYNWTNELDDSCIYISCLYYKEKILDYLLNNRFFNKDIIEKENKYNQHLIMRLISNKCNDLLIKKIINKCKENKELFNKKDSSNWNLFMYCCNYTDNLVHYILDNNLLNEKNLNSLSKSNNSFLILLIKRKSLDLLKILKKINLTEKIINNVNDNNESIFTFIDNIDIDSLKYLMNFNINYDIFKLTSKDNICPMVKLGSCDYNILDYFINDINMTNNYFETTNSSGENILIECLKKEYLENFNRIYYSRFCTENLLLKKENKLNRCSLHYFYENLIDISILCDILTKYDGKSIVNELDYYGNTLLTLYISNYDTNYVKLILELDLIDESVFDTFFDFRHFISLVLTSNLDILKIITSHKFFKEEYLFRYDDDNSISLFGTINIDILKFCLDNFDTINNKIMNMSQLEYCKVLKTISFLMPLENFIFFINSKCCDCKFLKKKDIYGHTLLRYLINNSEDKFKELINLEIIDEEIFNSIDYDYDSILNCYTEDSSINKFKLIINNKLFNKNLLNLENKTGYTPIFNIMNINLDHINFLFKNNLINNKLLLHKNVYGNICLHITKKSNTNVIKRILNSNFFNKEFLEIRNNIKQTIFMRFCEFNIDLVNYIFESEYMDKKLLLDRDLDGNNSLFYLFNNNKKSQVIDFFKKLSNSIYFDLDLILNRNNDNETIFFNLKKNDYLKLLLEVKGYDYHVLTKNNYDEKSCLIKYAIENVNMFKQIIKWERFSEKLLYYQVIDSDLNFFWAICEYNPSLISFIINTNINLDIFLYFDYEEDPLDKLLNNSPDQFNLFLNSKFGSEKIINFLFKYKNMFLYCLSNQPIGILHIINNKYFNKNFYVLEVEELLKEINKTFEGITLDNLDTIPLINKINIPCNEDDLDCCQICYSFKSTVIYGNCFHRSCISCSLKINKCHICRDMITNRHFTY
jgi:hypothetical protein